MSGKPRKLEREREGEKEGEREGGKERDKSRAIRLNDRIISDFSFRMLDCQADAMFVINRRVKQFFNSLANEGKRKSKARSCGQSAVRLSNEERKIETKEAVLTNYIVNKINRKNKNSKVEDEGWSVPRLLFPPRTNEYTCLFYSVEFDSLQQITASRLKKENRVSRAETFLSFFSPSPSFFFLLSFLDGRIDHPCNFSSLDNCCSSCTRTLYRYSIDDKNRKAIDLIVD